MVTADDGHTMVTSDGGHTIVISACNHYLTDVYVGHMVLRE